MNRQLIMVGVLLAVGGTIWFVFLGAVPVRTATGTIRSKTFTPAGHHIRYPVGDRQGFRSPTTIQMAEHFVLDIQVDGQPDQFRYAANTTAAAAFDIGQRVDIKYRTRGIPPFWSRVYVLDAQPEN